VVFENRVLRRIFGPERDEVMGEWRKRERSNENVFGSALSIKKYSVLPNYH
jgi:hypothetical protein